VATPVWRNKNSFRFSPSSFLNDAVEQ
jgi:hypothetical protein